MRLERQLGRQISRSSDPAADFVDEVLGPISLKGKLPRKGSVPGFIQSIQDDLSRNTFTKALAVNIRNLPRSVASDVRSATVRADNPFGKEILFIE
ncbi:MAG: hypothetical protein AAFY34_12255 [Pseudomonadota bacterium]